MKIFRKVLLWFVSFLLITGCVVNNNYSGKRKTEEKILPVINGGFNTALYKAAIDFGDHHFSGLFYFKILPDSSFRILFLSELGLNFLEFEYRNGKSKTLNCQEFLNNKKIINTLQSDLSLLLNVPMAKRPNKQWVDSVNQSVLIKLKSKSKRCYYFYDQKNEVVNIVQKSGLSQVKIQLSHNDNLVPQHIEIIHKPIKLSIKLNLLKLK